MKRKKLLELHFLIYGYVNFLRKLLRIKLNFEY